MTGNRLSNFSDSLLLDRETLTVPYLASRPDVFAGFLVVFVVIVVVLGVQISTRLFSAMAVANIAVVAFLFVAGFVLADLDNWRNGSFFPYGVSGVLSGAATCFFGYGGYDALTMCSEEALDYARSVPRAMGLSVVLVCLCYVAVSVSLTLVVPYGEIEAQSAFAHAFATHGLTWAKYVVGTGALCGMFTTLLGSMFALPRLVYAMASDGLLFAPLSWVSERTKVPVVAGALFGLIAALMAVVFDVRDLVEFLSTGLLTGNIFVSAAIIVIRYRSLSNDTISTGGDGRHDPPSDDTPEKRSDPKSRQFICMSRLTKYVASRDVVRVCLMLTVTFQVAAVVFIRVEIDELVEGKWWAGALVVVFAGLALLAFLPIPMHEQTASSCTYTVPFVPYLPMANILCNVVLMVMLRYVAWLRFAIWISVGVLLYAVYGYRHSVEGLRRSREEVGYRVISSDDAIPVRRALVLQQLPTEINKRE